MTASNVTSSSKEIKATKNVPFGGYYKSQTPMPHDPELTHVGPGTPMGEYMRRFWHPVCLSEQIGEFPKAVRILGEDLVVFRDKRNRMGLLHRQCSHRGASLEFGIVTERGIRCCYHGWLYDIDGTVLETPCEPKDSQLKANVCHGAYPAFERFGVVFAYMGPPESKPKFPEYDSFVEPKETRHIPYSNFYPCNWLQVYENIMDHFHTCTLHNNMVADGTSDELAARLTLKGFESMPVVHWETTHEGNGLAFASARRMSEDKVWVRITSAMLPNFNQVGSPTPQASRLRHSTVGHTRWTVPIDDENCVVIGLRHFNEEADPEGVGCEENLGVEKFDFLDGQVGGRPYDIAQRAPGDYEALTSQGKIVSHAAENPGRSDMGVYLLRRLLHAAVRGETAPNSCHRKWEQAGDSLPICTQDSVAHVPEQPGRDERAYLRELNHKMFEIMREADKLPSSQRDAWVRRRVNDDFGEGNALGMDKPAARAKAEVMA